MLVMLDIFTFTQVVFATLQMSFDLIFCTFNCKFMYLSRCLFIFLMLAASVLHSLIHTDVKADYIMQKKRCLGSFILIISQRGSQFQCTGVILDNKVYCLTVKYLAPVTYLVFDNQK